MARPEKWKDEYIHIAEHACRLGATDQDIADMLGVSVRTISYWRASKPEFADALKAGKEVADDRVERSLFHRAVGYQHDEVHVSNYQGKVTLTPLVKHYPPDTAAAIFWLKNRRKGEWRDKQDIEHGLTTELSELLSAVDGKSRGLPKGD